MHTYSNTQKNHSTNRPALRRQLTKHLRVASRKSFYLLKHYRGQLLLLEFPCVPLWKTYL